MISYKDRGMMKIVHFLLAILGAHPEKTGIMPNVISVFAVFSTFLTTFMMIIEIFLNWNGINTMKRLDYLPASVMWFVKAAVLTTSRTRLKKLFGMLDNFWQRDKFTPEVQVKCEKTFTLVRNFFVVFYSYGCSTIVYTLYVVLTTEIRALPNKGYDVCDYESNSPCFYGMVTWHIAMMFTQAAPSMLGFDMVFFACATYVYVASVMLSAGLENMQLSIVSDPVIAKANMKDFVDQHNHLLKFVKATNEYCFVAFAAQFLCSAGSMVFCMFLSTVDGIPPDRDHLRFIQLFILFASQLYVINLAGTLSKDKLIGIADSAYETKWFVVGEGKLRRDMSLIILRAQTSYGLRVASVFDLNLNLFVVVCRASFSIYTLLDQLS